MRGMPDLPPAAAFAAHAKLLGVLSVSASAGFAARKAHTQSLSTLSLSLCLSLPLSVSPPPPPPHHHHPLSLGLSLSRARALSVCVCLQLPACSRTAGHLTRRIAQECGGLLTNVVVLLACARLADGADEAPAGRPHMLPVRGNWRQDRRAQGGSGTRGCASRCTGGRAGGQQW